MKRKPLEKLSDRLTRLFLSCVTTYDYLYFSKLTSTTEACTDYRPIDLAKKMSERVMDMIDEYEPEDIEPWCDRLARVTKEQMNMEAKIPQCCEPEDIE